MKNKLIAMLGAVSLFASLLCPISFAEGIYINANDFVSKSDSLTIRTENHALANGTVAEIKADSLPEGGLSIEYSFEISKAGEYSLEISGGKYDISSLSKYSVGVDGNDCVPVNQDNVSSSKNHPSGGNFARYLSVYELAPTFSLTEGAHTLTFRITEARSNGAVYSFFEYASFNQIEDDPNAPVEDIYVYGTSSYSEKSEILTINTTTHELNNGSMARFTGAALDDSGTLYIKYPFNVKREGAYALSVSAGRYDVNHLSPYSFSIDDTSFKMDSEIVTNYAPHPDGGNYSTLVGRYDTNIILNLTSGAHELTFTITGLRSQGNVYQFLEYFKMSYIDEVAMVLEVENLISSIGEITIDSKPLIDEARGAFDSLLEYLKGEVNNYDVLTAAERAYKRLLMGGGASITVYGSDTYTNKSEGLTYSVSTLFDNKKVVALTSKVLPNDGLSITYPFDVLIDGEYKMYLSSPKYTNIYMSPYSISVDGGAFRDIGEATVENSSAHPSGGSYDEYLGRYETNLLYNLSEGTHFVTMKITGLRSNGDVYDFLEYIKFVLSEEIIDAKFTSDKVLVPIGNSYEAAITSVGKISGENVDITQGEIIYRSLSPKVAAVDEDGLVTVLGFGEAVIEADIKYKGHSGTVSQKVIATANNMYVEDSFFTAGGKINYEATVHNVAKDKKANAEVVLVIYKNGALWKCATDTVEIDADGLAESKVSIDNFSASNDITVMAYVWDKGSEPSLISYPKTLQ